MRQARSIAVTLTGINMLVSGVALLLAIGALGLYDRTSFRDGVVRSLSIQAQIIATNSTSALLFDDPTAAEQSLAALDAAPTIISATIYRTTGHVFALYARDPERRTPLPPAIPVNQAEVYRFDNDSVIVARRIVFQGKLEGIVAIESNLQDLTTRRAQYLAIIAAVLIASMFAALIVSRLAQRIVSSPITRLAEVVSRVSRERSYAVRAPKAAAAEEIGMLTDAFNDMLAQIQERDQSLNEAHNELEARVLQRTAELETANRELEAFSYSVSHDLRAPVRHVTGFAGLLEARAKDQLDAKSRRYLSTITESAQRMGQLIDDLLAFSRIGRGQLNRQPVNLNELVQEARQDVTVDPATSARQIEWEIGNLPEVDGDPAMLRLVLVNLLSNAVKYSAPRTPAHIEVGSREDADGSLVVFVRDNGVGFDMQYAHKLFGVFQRLHRPEEFEGTGIGLANVQRIVHRHGGRVWAESELHHGSTFSFSLPVRKGRTPVGATPPRTEQDRMPMDLGSEALRFHTNG